jgi:hypothetical protein
VVSETDNTVRTEEHVYDGRRVLQHSTTYAKSSKCYLICNPDEMINFYLTSARIYIYVVWWKTNLIYIIIFCSSSPLLSSIMIHFVNVAHFAKQQEEMKLFFHHTTSIHKRIAYCFLRGRFSVCYSVHKNDVHMVKKKVNGMNGILFKRYKEKRSETKKRKS